MARQDSKPSEVASGVEDGPGANGDERDNQLEVAIGRVKEGA